MGSNILISSRNSLVISTCKKVLLHPYNSTLLQVEIAGGDVKRGGAGLGRINGGRVIQGDMGGIFNGGLG